MNRHSDLFTRRELMRTVRSSGLIVGLAEAARLGGRESFSTIFMILEIIDPNHNAEFNVAFAWRLIQP
jgi:hypothetical protein